MSKIKMLVINEFDNINVSLSTGVEIATLPLINTQKYNNSRTFRSTSVDEIQITGNLDSLKLMSALVLWRTNLSNTATMQLEFFANDNQSGDVVYDSTEINAIPQITVGEWDWQSQSVTASIFDGWPTRYSQIWLDPVFAKSFRLTIKDPLNTDDFIDITRIYMGRHFEPDINFSYGHSNGWQSTEEQYRTDDGSNFTQQSANWRKQQFNLEHLNNADRPHFTNAVRHVTKNRDWFITLFPGIGGQKEVEYAFACKFSEIPSVTGAYHNNYQSQIVVEEC